MKSVITTSKTVIPNIPQQTHELAVLNKGNRTCTATKGEGRKITESDMSQFMKEAWCTIHIQMVFML
jgi:hypothetical protein